jgi:hypothetical protein
MKRRKPKNKDSLLSKSVLNTRLTKDFIMINKSLGNYDHLSNLRKNI